MTVARVVTELSLDREFDYLVPPDLASRVRAGSRVRIPFGKSQRVGYVIGLKAASEYPDLKEIIGVEGDRAQIPDALLKLADWIAEYYCCTKEQAVRALLPAVVRGGRMKHKRERYACLGEKWKHKGGDLEGLTAKQRQMLETLVRLGSCPVSELLENSGAGPSVLKKLEALEWVTMEERVVGRDPFENDILLPSLPLKLTPAQARALASIQASLDAGGADVILLHGVTGSGKTEVYLQAIQHCLDMGREAIVLVPEIALTPQTCERFRRRFGDLVSVLHSGLSDGERFDEWTRIREGHSRIAVGARSALFAPFTRLGLIVVDEEHEATYKQDEAPRYNARDVAVVRGGMEQATVVLGTATPSLETYYNCQIGRYKLLELPQRVDDCRMPAMEVVDMCAEAAFRGQPQIFSRRLEVLVNERLANGEQIIFFLNRRGYATQMLCTKCGYVAGCEDCSVTYTYHRADQILCCHLCGRVLKAPETCPQCGDSAIRYGGLGTEKVEAAARALFRHAAIARMDSDTMTTRKSYETTLDDFRAGRINILIGTQMIAKGLHFPNVTLVGIIFADLGLYIPDFRSGERTFQLLTQVAGRAGRGEVPGRVVVQSYTPYHPALKYALEHNFKGFYEEEMTGRQSLSFPPVTHMILVHFRSPDEGKAADTAEQFADIIRPHLPRDVIMSSPMPAPTAKVRNQYRYQVSLRGGNTRVLVRMLRKMIVGGKPAKDVDVYVDVDPRSMM